MKTRELFWAVDGSGNRVHIDHLDKTQAKLARFFCPHCDNEVIAKMGDQKVWHFAHKGEVCRFLLGRETDTSKATSLGQFSEKTVDLKDVKISRDPEGFICAKCDKFTNKSNGVQWKKDTWFCKECFKEM